MKANELVFKIQHTPMNTLDIPVKVNGKEVTDIELVGSNKDGDFYFNLKAE